MASSVIHMCVAKRINEKLKMNQNMILLGSIAPDISKHLGETKTKPEFKALYKQSKKSRMQSDRFLKASRLSFRDVQDLEKPWFCYIDLDI